MTQQRFEEDLLRRWFPQNAEETLTPFTENDIRDIADVLTRCARERWSQAPRLYSILRKIGQLDTIDAFIDSDITDVCFPFTKSTLPEALSDHSARLRFLELQHLVYNTEALNLERRARHGHFGDPTEVPLKKIGELGKGGYGYVDRVVSTISHREYARKLIPRGRTFKKDKQVLKDFTKELSNLKRLSHKHLVELVGSYTDSRFVVILMLPVADTNLQMFLERTDLDEKSRSFLRPFFGCLTSALCYLHDNRIRHKDIKPSNILIKGDQVYFTDFGTALDWSDRGSSITATSAPTTPRYCAPEVMAYTQRNSSSDIWSFGCVFLEMWTVLRSRPLQDLRTYMTAHGSGAKEYYSNLEAIMGWLDVLRSSAELPSDLIPSTWIEYMLRQMPTERWNVHVLENHIEEICADSSVQYMFKGICCLELDDHLSEDEWSSAEDSEDQSADQSQPQHTYRSERAKRSPVGLKIIQTVPMVALEDNQRSVSPIRLPRTVRGNDRIFVANAAGACRVQEPAGRFEQTSGYPLGHTAIDRDESSTQTPVLRGSNVANGETDSRLETAMKHVVSSNSGVIEGVGVITHHPNQLKSWICSWNLSLMGEDDDETDDKIFQPPLDLIQREAVSDFEAHASICGHCSVPLHVFSMHGKLCTKGLRLAYALLVLVYRSTSGVSDIRINSMHMDPLRRRPLEVVNIPPYYVQVKSLLKAIKLSKRCSGNKIFLLRYCDNPNHRYWQEFHPCSLCKIPLGPRTGRLMSGELVHETCALSGLINGGTKGGNRENDEKQPLDSRLLPGGVTSNDPRRRPPEVPRPEPKKSGVRTFIDDLLLG
jgi:serine/threonine protein kinase